MSKRLSRNERRWYETEYLRSAHWIWRRGQYLRGVYYCELCRFRPAVEVHHVSYEHLKRERDSDLLGLCRICHGRLHKRPSGDEAAANDNQLELPLVSAVQKCLRADVPAPAAQPKRSAAADRR